MANGAKTNSQIGTTWQCIAPESRLCWNLVCWCITGLVSKAETTVGTSDLKWQCSLVIVVVCL